MAPADVGAILDLQKHNEASEPFPKGLRGFGVFYTSQQADSTFAIARHNRVG